jgi:hypothetical protein
MKVPTIALCFAVAMPLALADRAGGKGPRFPNLAAAQKLVQQAADKITAAQKANEYDLGGHAKKAKDLLDQAAAEIKLATEAADDRREKN